MASPSSFPQKHMSSSHNTKSLQMKQKNSINRAVGNDLAAVLPAHPRPFWRIPHLLKLNAILLVPMFSSATVGYDGALMNGLQIAPYWKKYFHDLAGAKLGAINAMYPVGKVCALTLVTPLSDKFGRRPLLIAAFIICIFGGAIQGAAVDFGMLLFSRWLLGVGTGMMAQPSPILITELAYPTHRGKLTALYNTFYYFGAIFAAWLTYGSIKNYSNDWSWRIPSALQAGLPLLQLIGSTFLPESPRWLIAQGQTERARSILTQYHAGGNQRSPLVDYEVNEIQEALRIERESENSGLRNFLATPSNRKRAAIAVTLGIIAQWAGNGVVTYYISLVLDTVGITSPINQSLINGGLQIFNFAVAVFVGALMVDRLGRRKLFLWSALGMCISYIIWTILTSRFIATKTTGFGIAVIPMIFLFYFHYDIAITPLLYAYPTEIFPYATRGWGVSLTYAFSYCALIVSLFVNPIAMQSISWRYYIVFCVLNMVFFTIVWFAFPETKGHTLEEIAIVFDGGDAAVRKAIPETCLTKKVDKDGEATECLEFALGGNEDV